MSLREIPAYREELYEMLVEKLRKKGVCDDGLAYEVTDKVMRGYYAKAGGVDEATMSALLDLGFDMDFVFFLSDIKYMFPKALGIAYICTKRLR
jgi:DNA polymerase III alpha subunit (gram-positive type)